MKSLKNYFAAILILWSPSFAFAQQTLAIHYPGLLQNPEPQLSKGRLWLSIPSALVLGYAGLGGGFLFGQRVLNCSDEGTQCENAPDNAEIWLSGGVGLILGSAVGAQLGGLRKDSKGNFAHTLLWAAIGYLPILIDELIPGGPAGGQPSLISGLGIVGAPVAAALANNSKRMARR